MREFQLNTPLYEVLDGMKDNHLADLFARIRGHAKNRLLQRGRTAKERKRDRKKVMRINRHLAKISKEFL